MCNIEICGIFDEDKAYTLRLVNYMNSRGNLPFEVVAFTEAGTIADYMDTVDINILLVSERIDTTILNISSIDRVIILTEEDTKREGSVYKYQPITAIIESILSITGRRNYIPDNSQTEVIGIYSPVSKSRRTTLGLNMAYEYARDRRVLFISLEEYSGFQSYFGFEKNTGLSDIMYDYFENQQSFVSNMDAYIQKYKNVDIIQSCFCKEDIHKLMADDICKMTALIANSGIYNVIIIDAGNAVKEVYRVLSVCTKIYITALSDKLSTCKLNEFKNVDKYLFPGKKCVQILEVPVDRNVEYGNIDALAGESEIVSQFVKGVMANE